MLRELPYVVQQVYIHKVQPLSKTYGIQRAVGGGSVQEQQIAAAM